MGDNPSLGLLQQIHWVTLSQASQNNLPKAVSDHIILWLNAPYYLMIKPRFLNLAVKIFHILVLGNLVSQYAPSAL